MIDGHRCDVQVDRCGFKRGRFQRPGETNVLRQRFLWPFHVHDERVCIPLHVALRRKLSCGGTMYIFCGVCKLTTSALEGHPGIISLRFVDKFASNSTPRDA